MTIFDNRTKEEFYYECDELLLNLGFLTNLGPIKQWGFEIVGNSIQVNSRMETNIPGVYGAGDIVDYHGKLKLIATGFGEAAIAVNHAKAYVDPTAKVNPGHSSENVPDKKPHWAHRDAARRLCRRGPSDRRRAAGRRMQTRLARAALRDRAAGRGADPVARAWMNIARVRRCRSCPATASSGSIRASSGGTGGACRAGRSRPSMPRCWTPSKSPTTFPGDNLIVRGIDLAAFEPGDVLRVGDALLVATATPHRPCAKFARRTSLTR